MSAAASWLAAPRKVHMVRWPSGVTLIMQTPVARPCSAPSTSGAVSKATPAARISWVKTPPSWSSATLPI